MALRAGAPPRHSSAERPLSGLSVRHEPVGLPRAIRTMTAARVDSFPEGPLRPADRRPAHLIAAKASTCNSKSGLDNC